LKCGQGFGSNQEVTDIPVKKTSFFSDEFEFLEDLIIHLIYLPFRFFSLSIQSLSTDLDSEWFGFDLIDTCWLIVVRATDPTTSDKKRCYARCHPLFRPDDTAIPANEQ
jgi:hypothetical protein